MDSISRVDTPRLNEFIRGLKHATVVETDSPYASGLHVGMQLSQMIAGMSRQMFGEDADESLNTNQVLAGLIKALREQQTVMSTAEATEIFQREMQRAQAEQTARHEAELRGQFEEVIAAGAAFLAENARREGVVTLPSGLQYEIIRAGTGEKPTETDRVRVHYHGTLIDGTVFDSSIERSQDIVFPVNQVISGWTEALQLMPVGSKWRLYLPYDLAYGSQDTGMIGPFSVLIFDVELLEIVR